MHKEHQIATVVYEAKNNMQTADRLIREYIPFIKKEVAAFLRRICSEQDDEYSIALMAFHEAILSYEKKKGTFLGYASLIIRSRLIDYGRKEARHLGHASIEAEDDITGVAFVETLADDKNPYEEKIGLEATKQEIEELRKTMEEYGVCLSDVADNSPKQERTLEACTKVVRYAIADKSILDDLLKTKKLPISKLAKGAEVEKKTLERHRKYILVMLLIQTNGYEIIRGHIRHVISEKGGVSA